MKRIVCGSDYVWGMGCQAFDEVWGFSRLEGMEKDFKKDFDGWNGRKKALQGKERAELFFREREIWWSSIGVNLGIEADGKGNRYSRPILILKKFNPHVFWALPLTTQFKNSRYYFPLPDREDAVILSQLRLMDYRRLLLKRSILRLLHNATRVAILGPMSHPLRVACH